jgi:GT2 family glycosyltransferase
VLLAETLASVTACEPAPVEVVVVDAADDLSADPAVKAAARAHPDIALRHLGGVHGACRQRNRGMDAASGDLLLFLDDDVLLSPDAVGRLVAAFDDPTVVAATGRVLEPPRRRIALNETSLRRLLPGSSRQGTFTPSGYPNRLWRPDEPGDIEILYGCFMATLASIAREVRFDPRLEATNGYALAEDEDFACRLSRRGVIRYVPSAVVEHRITGFSSSHSREFNRSLVRNRDYLFRKNFSPTLVARAHWWMIMGIHVAHRALNGDWQGVAGLVEGLREVLFRRRPS